MHTDETRLNFSRSSSFAVFITKSETSEVHLFPIGGKFNSLLNNNNADSEKYCPARFSPGRIFLSLNVPTLSALLIARVKRPSTLLIQRLLSLIKRITLSVITRSF